MICISTPIASSTRSPYTYPEAGISDLCVVSEAVQSRGCYGVKIMIRGITLLRPVRRGIETFHGIRRS